MKKWLAAPGIYLMLLFLLTLPYRLLASGEGLEMPDAVDKQVPLDGLSGISLFFAQTYNDNLVLYAVFCTALMALVGIMIAYITDAILKGMGLDVSRIEHEE